MISRGLLTFTDRNGDPAGEILLEELKRMPPDWLETVEDRGLTWELGKSPLCGSCLTQSLTDEDFDPEFDACEKCKPLFRPEKPPICVECRQEVADPKTALTLTYGDGREEIYCSESCLRVRPFCWTARCNIGTKKRKKLLAEEKA